MYSPYSWVNLAEMMVMPASSIKLDPVSQQYLTQIKHF